MFNHLISCWVSGSKSVLGDAKRVEASVAMRSEMSLTKELANFSGDGLQDFVFKGVASSVRLKLK